MKAAKGREGLRSANKFCDIGSLTVEDKDEDYSVPKG